MINRYSKVGKALGRVRALRERQEKMRRKIAEFAEALSEHGSVSQAAIDCGISQSQAAKYLRIIKTELGPQAE